MLEKDAAPRGGVRQVKFRAILAALVLTAALTAGAPPRPGALCGEVPAIARTLTAISGLQLRRPVPCDFISKAKVNEFLKKRAKEVARPEDIRVEELTLKKFGLLPAGYDLLGGTVDLLTEQAAAFYDYNRKKLFITETTAEESQEPVLAHEISHALADQNFNLGKFIRQGHKDDDGDTARLAVMEGQATWLMSEYVARKAGRTLENSPALVAMMSSAGESGGQFPVFDKAPLYLRNTLLFPYTRGMQFQDAVFQHSGQAAFAEVFRKAPVSTEQILHPERYFQNRKPLEPAVTAPALPRGYKNLAAGTMGELDIAILLEQYAGRERAAEIAPHWRGFTFALYENRKAGRVVLAYASEWDSEEAAGRYFDAYRTVLEHKWKGLAVSSESPAALDGTGDDGRFELRHNGTRVTAVEGLDPAAPTAAGGLH
jgi:hypothetical protein